MVNPTLPNDIDPQETKEWIEALESVLAADGPERALPAGKMIDKARRRGLSAVHRHHRLPEHHPGGQGTALARQP